ncbi:MAG: hypothetical protein EBS87_11950 [Sphingomonadaceae bacterium]|nr:hypothetical protein [Sphingomonadaceae bacterium]NCA02850.1 hypothetical protein [Sphingomonadaceae bacterium]
MSTTIDVSDILSRAEAAFEEYDAAKARFDTAQARVNLLAREFSITTKTYAFKDYMLRKEVNSWRGQKYA